MKLIRHIIWLVLLTCPAFAQVTVLNSCQTDNAWAINTTVSCTIAGLHTNSLVYVVGYACQKGIGNFCDNNLFSTSQAISDTAGLTYTQRFHSIINSCCTSWTVGDLSVNDTQSAGFSGSDTFTLTTGSTARLVITVYEFSNVKTTGYYDVKNLVSTASVCSLPGSNLIDPITPTGGSLVNVVWTINIGCTQDGGAIGTAVAYNTTLGTSLIVGQGAGGNFAFINSPFTQLGGSTSGTGYLEVSVSSSQDRHHVGVF